MSDQGLSTGRTRQGKGVRSAKREICRLIETALSMGVERRIDMGAFHRERKARVFFVVVFLGFFAVCLHQAHAFPAPKLKEAVVFSWHTAGGSVKTLFISLMSGPSPEDVASFTVTGPSGTFDLVPNRSYRQYGLQYVHEENSVVTNGAYTFLLTDSQGRTASVVRKFTYNPSVPQVNSATMNPANGSYVGTTTPTLSFEPAPGGWYYQVIVLDYSGVAIWYLGPKTTATSFAVPPGLLQTDTPYIWMARVFDSDTDPQNVHLSDTLYFFTGTKDAPVLNEAYVAGWPYYGDKYRSVLVGKPLNIAPWDIDSFWALGPDSTVYVLDFPMHSFHSPTYYIDIVDVPSLQSIPDGDYTITIQDKLGRLDSEICHFVHTPLPPFSAGSFYPGDNAYLDTNRPTFTWPRIEGDLGDGTYLYFVRINGYTSSGSSGIIWYQSEPGVETFHTLPAELNLAEGSSYEWQYAAMGPGDGYNNWQFSVHHTFTVNDCGVILYIAPDGHCDGNSPCYSQIQNGIEEEYESAAIRVQQGHYPENLIVHHAKKITLEPGWEPTFTTITGGSTVKKLTLTGGTTTIGKGCLGIVGD
jgi:hypothetical protein